MRNVGWKRSKSISKPNQPADLEALNSGTSTCNAPLRDLLALQDFALTEHPAFVGLISMVTGSTLQDDIARSARRLVELGHPDDVAEERLAVHDQLRRPGGTAGLEQRHR